MPPGSESTPARSALRAEHRCFRSPPVLSGLERHHRLPPPMRLHSRRGARGGSRIVDAVCCTVAGLMTRKVLDTDEAFVSNLASGGPFTLGIEVDANPDGPRSEELPTSSWESGTPIRRSRRSA